MLTVFVSVSVSGAPELLQVPNPDDLLLLLTELTFDISDRCFWNSTRPLLTRPSCISKSCTILKIRKYILLYIRNFLKERLKPVFEYLQNQLLNLSSLVVNSKRLICNKKVNTLTYHLIYILFSWKFFKI